MLDRHRAGLRRFHAAFQIGRRLLGEGAAQQLAVAHEGRGRCRPRRRATCEDRRSPSRRRRVRRRAARRARRARRAGRTRRRRGARRRFPAPSRRSRAAGRSRRCWSCPRWRRSPSAGRRRGDPRRSPRQRVDAACGRAGRRAIGAHRAAADAEHAGGALDRVVRLGRRVDGDRPVDAVGRRVATEPLEGALPRGAEREQVGHRAAAAVHALHAPRPNSSASQLQRQRLEEVERGDARSAAARRCRRRWRPASTRSSHRW